jgi:hypothetical protein
MSNVPYAPVTVLDTAASVGAADASIYVLDYRFAGSANFAMNFIGTLASVGAADSVRLQVSPDYRQESPTKANAMWGSVEVFTSTAFNGSLNGPWAAIRFLKSGDQVAKVVGLLAGASRNKADIQG